MPRRIASPGFDPAHPASQGIEGSHGFSAVAASGGFVNLVTGSKGTNTAGFVNGAFTTLGSNLRLVNSISNYNFPGAAIADAVGTLAAIYTVDSAADGGNIVLTDSAGSLGMALRNTQFVLPGIVGIPHGLAIPANTPILQIASKGPTVVNFVVVNLLTGLLVSAAVANANTPGAPNGGGLPAIGGSPTGPAGSITGNVAAAMWAPVHLSMPQLKAWAADPWAFWYPRLKIRRAAPSTAIVSGVLAATEAADTAALTGASSVNGTLAAIDAIDIASFAGSITTLPTGALAVSELPDLAVFHGTSAAPPAAPVRPSYRDYEWEAGRPRQHPTKWT